MITRGAFRYFNQYLHLCFRILTGCGFVTLILIQDHIEIGETLGLVLLGSDKTHLTVVQGDKECHPVYMSCGNIKKNIRTKLAARCWMMVAQVPLAKFEETKLQGLLTNRVLHLCLDRVLEGLKRCARSAQLMLDPCGGLRKVRTFLAAYIADLPEQQVLACVSAYNSPVSVAGPSDLGNSEPCALRYGSRTLQAIRHVLEKVPCTTDLPKVKKASRDYGLNGVTSPFWRDWLHSDPAIFLAPDALHQWHKFFVDHPIEWAKSWLGNEEIDKRLSVLQPRIGSRHFRQGFTRFRQHTSKETKDLERVFLAVIAGHDNVTPGILTAMRGLMDFIYMAQYDCHSTTTLYYLQDALETFHRHKKHIAASGVRKGMRRNDSFNIPKLELMQHVRRLIEQLGSTPQFSSEQTERCHIDMAKIPYKSTNRKEFAEQMCRHLDRTERMALFLSLIEWRQHAESKASSECASSDSSEHSSSGQVVKCHGLLGAQSREGRGAAQLREYLPTLAQAVFGTRSPFCSETTAFRLRRRPDAANVSIQVVTVTQDLPHFENDLKLHVLGSRTRHGICLPFETIDMWWRMRIQIKDPQNVEFVLAPQTVEARPPLQIGHNSKPGRYHFVLLRMSTNHTGIGLKGM